MRKLLLLAGIFTVLVHNAYARYYDSGYYREEQPRYEHQRQYRAEPRHTNRHYSISKEEEQNYRERKYLAKNSNTICPYIGVDIATTSMKFGKNEWIKGYDEDDNEFDRFEKNNKTFSLVAGAKFTPHFGMEAFYQKSGKETLNGEEESYDNENEEYDYTEKNELSYVAYGVDAIGYIPVTQEFEILASLGIAQYDFKTKSSGIERYTRYDKYKKDSIFDESTDSEEKDFDSLGIRFGLGAQYNINEHLALRAMARYVKMNDDEYVKSLTEISLGLRYMF